MEARFVATKLVVVAYVVVLLPVIVRFPFTVDEALEMKPVRVESPVIFNVVPTARDPVKLAVEEIV